VRVALVGQDVAHGVPDACGDGIRSALGQGAAAGEGAVVQGVEDGVEQRPQGLGAFGA
jgi:hypothetical protein